MVALTVDKGSSVAEGSQCVRQQGDTFFPFTICADGRVGSLRVDAQQVDLVDGNAQGKGKDIFKVLCSDQIIKLSMFANPL